MKKFDRQDAIKVLRDKYPNSRFDYPEEVVRAWKDFVEEITSGIYNGIENEYWNDLDIREVIDEMGYGESEEVKKIDQKFRKILINTSVRNWGYDDSRIDDWWNFGYPKTLGGYLKSYFESDKRFR